MMGWDSSKRGLLRVDSRLALTSCAYTGGMIGCAKSTGPRDGLPWGGVDSTGRGFATRKLPTATVSATERVSLPSMFAVTSSPMSPRPSTPRR